MLRTALLGCAALLWAGSAQAALTVHLSGTADLYQQDGTRTDVPLAQWGNQTITYDATFEFGRPQSPLWFEASSASMTVNGTMDYDLGGDADLNFFENAIVPLGAPPTDVLGIIGYVSGFAGDHSKTYAVQIYALYDLGYGYISSFGDETPEIPSVEYLSKHVVYYSIYNRFYDSRSQAFGTIQFSPVDGSTLSMDGALPAYIAPPPAAPEPATWLMMIAGFGLIGGALRRRTRVTYAPSIR